MKRFGFITLAVLTAVFFSSCNDSDGDYASSWAFASAETLSNDYYFVLDDDKTVYPSDKSQRSRHTSPKTTSASSSSSTC